MAYVAQQRLDGYEAAIIHALKRKETFDRRVLKSPAVKFSSTRVSWFRFIAVTWTTPSRLSGNYSQNGPSPRRVTERLHNSYKLETLEGTAITGEFSARRLRAFIPQAGTILEQQQMAFEANLLEPKEPAFIDPPDS